MACEAHVHVVYAQLTVFHDDRPARRYLLQSDRAYSAGCDPSCDIVLDDARVSRRHAAFSFDGGAWVCRDTGSKNGTRLNGNPGEAHRLGGNAWLDLGGLLAHFCVQTRTTRVAAEQRDTVRRRLSREIGQQIDSAANADTLFDSLLDAVLGLAGTRRAFLMLENASDDFQVLAERGFSADDYRSETFMGSVGVLEEVAKTGRSVVSCDAVTHSRFGERPSIAGGGIRALMCVPVKVNDRRRAILYTDSDQPGKVFDELDMEILESLAERAGVAIAAGLLRESLQEMSAAFADASAGMTLSRLLERRTVVETAGT